MAKAGTALHPSVHSSDIWRDAFNFVHKSSFSEGFMGLGGNRAPFFGHSIGLAIDENPVIAHSSKYPLRQGMALGIDTCRVLGMVCLENTFLRACGGKSLSGSDTGILFF